MLKSIKKKKKKKKREENTLEAQLNTRLQAHASESWTLATGTLVTMGNGPHAEQAENICICIIVATTLLDNSNLTKKRWCGKWGANI